MVHWPNLVPLIDVFFHNININIQATKDGYAKSGPSHYSVSLCNSMVYTTQGLLAGNTNPQK